MEHFGIDPDLTCVGKSIGGGLPISGIVGKADIIDNIPPGGLGGTFGGNPMACAAALAVMDAFESENLLQKGLEMGEGVYTHKNNGFQPRKRRERGSKRSCLLVQSSS